MSDCRTTATDAASAPATCIRMASPGTTHPTATPRAQPAAAGVPFVADARRTVPADQATAASDVSLGYLVSTNRTGRIVCVAFGPERTGSYVEQSRQSG